MKVRLFATLITGMLAGAASVHALAVNFTSGPTDTANGYINIPIGASPTIYTNIGNLGYDIRFNYTNNSVISATSAPSTDGPAFDSVLALLANNSFLEVEFLQTGTNNPISVLGVQFRIDDVEVGGGTNEALTGFSYVDKNGNLQNPLFSDTDIFTADPGTVVDNGGTEFYYAGLNSTFQTGRGTLVDLSETAIQSFRIERNAIGSGTSALTLGLGEPTPIPFDGSPLLGMAAVAGYLGWRVRRKNNGADAVEATA